MTKEFVTYDQALALKELGFNKPCLAYWNYYTQELNYNSHPSTFHSEDVIQLPLKQQVLRWFREKYGWYANLSSWIHEEEIGTYHEYEIYGTPKGAYGSIKFKTYEEAENTAIDKLIEIAKQQEDGTI